MVVVITPFERLVQSILCSGTLGWYAELYMTRESNRNSIGSEGCLVFGKSVARTRVWALLGKVIYGIM